MKRTAILVVAGLLIAAGMVAVGARVLARDRTALHARFAAERLRALEEAAAGLGRDVEKISEDLELAATLMAQSSLPEIRERELHAIAAITREYLAVELRDGAGTTLTRVVAPDASRDVLERAAAALDHTARQALAHPGAFKTSRPLGDDEDLAWYRVFARCSPSNDDLVVAVVVDMRPLLARLSLLEDPSSALLVVGAHGMPAPLSDPRLAERVRHLSDRDAPDSGLGRLMAFVRARRTGTTSVSESEAHDLGLPAASAVAVTAPVLIEDGEPWALARVASTVTLRTQERTLLRRMLAGGAVAGLVLFTLSFYFVHNARRAAALHERLRQADRMAHLTEKAEKILDHIPTGVLALTEDGRISDVNRWLTERLGRDVTGQELNDAFSAVGDEHLAELHALVADALATRSVRSRHRVELSLWGEQTRVNLHAVPLAARLGDVHVLLVIEDLEPLRRIEDRLLHSEKLVTAGQLAAGIAHEIGTPLNVVRARAELALARLGDDHAQSGGQKVILDQIDHVSRLISQLLDYVRSAVPAARAVDPAAALGAAAELLAPELAKRDVAIAVDVAADTPAVRADPGQLQQVLVNLTVNALDACGRGGAIQLRARPAAAGQVAIEVADDGPGIEPAIRAQVFDPFFTTKKRGRGTGLGLWVVAQVVRAHDAEIELDSHPGAGTLVRILWPAHAPNPPAPDRSPVAP